MPCPTRTGKELDAICDLADAQNAALAELAAACRERMKDGGPPKTFRLLNAVKAAEYLSENAQCDGAAGSGPKTN